MKRLYRALSLLICIIMVFGFIGCKHQEENKEEQKNVDLNHYFEIGNTDSYVLKNGSVNYSILLPDSPTTNEKIAAQEFNLFFKEATGVSLDVVSDSQYASGKKYISIGETVLAKSVEDKLQKSRLGDEGVRVLTSDNNIICCGAGDVGTINSVYELLHQMVNYEFVGPESYILNTGVRNIALKNYDIVDIPDIARRTTGYGYVFNNDVTIRRLKLTSSWDEMFVGVDGIGRIHNALNYFNGYDDPDYFATSNAQLCYTGHGNEEKVEEMISIVGDRIITALSKDPKADLIEFTQMDNADWCRCDACKEYAEEYGTDSAVVIKFMNKLNRYIKSWMETEDGQPHKKDYKLVFFAYMSTEKAPVEMQNGNYVPMSEDLVCDPELAVLYAPITVDFTASIYDKINQSQYDTMIKWKNICQNMVLWLYGTNFRDYLVPYDITNSIQDEYKFASEANAITVFNQAQLYQTGSATGWQTLSSYLDSKFAWNNNYDLNDLINNYIEGFFGEAAEMMRKYFDEYRLHMFNLAKDGTYSGLSSIYIGVTTDAKKKTRFPIQLMKKWYNYCDEAIESISWLKDSNPYRYSLLNKHIVNERIFPLYILCDMYYDSFTGDEVTAMRNQFKSDVNLIGLNLFKEGHQVSELYTKWGI